MRVTNCRMRVNIAGAQDHKWWDVEAHEWRTRTQLGRRCTGVLNSELSLVFEIVFTDVSNSNNNLRVVERGEITSPRFLFVPRAEIVSVYAGFCAARHFQRQGVLQLSAKAPSKVGEMVRGGCHAMAQVCLEVSFW